MNRKHKEVHACITDGFASASGRITALEQWRKQFACVDVEELKTIRALKGVVERWGQRVARLERAQGPEEGTAQYWKYRAEARLEYVRELERGREEQAATIVQLRGELDLARAGTRVEKQAAQILREMGVADKQAIARLSREKQEANERIRELEGDVLRLQGEKEIACTANLVARCTSCRHRYNFPCGWVTVEGWAACPLWHAPEVKPEPERTCSNCYRMGRGCGWVDAGKATCRGWQPETAQEAPGDAVSPQVAQPPADTAETPHAATGAEEQGAGQEGRTS